jgi:hypothetical protein
MVKPSRLNLFPRPMQRAVLPENVAVEVMYSTFIITSPYFNKRLGVAAP